MKKKIIKTQQFGGAGGEGSTGQAIYECMFCGALHIQGTICPNLIRVIKDIKK